MAARPAKPKKVLELRLVGKGLSPGALDIGELADILKALREGIGAFVDQFSRPPGSPRIPVLLGLETITNGSVCLSVTTPEPALVIPAVARFNATVRARDLMDAPDAFIDSAQKIQALAKRLDFNAELYGGTARTRPSAVITPKTEFRTPIRVAGPTTLFGKVERAGGATAPRVLLRVPERSALLPCDATEETVRVLGARMYEWVGLSGFASWNSKDMSLRSFRIEAVEQYSDEGTYEEAFRAMREAVGDAWRAVDDPDAFAASLRQG